MERRLFLKSSAAIAAASALPWRGASAAEQGWRSYEVTTRVEILKPRGVSRAWLPLPLEQETGWHRSLGNQWSGNAARAEVLSDGKYGATMLYAMWTGDAPVIELVSRFATRDRAVDLSRPRGDVEPLSAAQRQFFTAPSELIPTDGIVRETATGIVKGAKSDVEKSRAIYEWVVENTFRDPKVRGCGWGDIKSMLETRNFGGSGRRPRRATRRPARCSS